MSEDIMEVKSGLSSKILYIYPTVGSIWSYHIYYQDEGGDCDRDIICK